MLETNFPQVPRLRREFSYVPMEDRVALLRSADRTLVFRGDAVLEVLPRLLPLLDGTHTLADITALLGNVDQAVVVQAVALFAERDLLELETPSFIDPGDQALEAFWRAVSSPLEQIPSLKNARVLITAECGSGKSYCLARAYRQCLVEMGVGHITEAPIDPALDWKGLVAGNDLVMFMPDRPSLAVRDLIHDACLTTRTKLSTASFLTHTELIVGPTVIPGETACWKCHDQRVAGVQAYHREYEAFQQFLKEHADVDPVSSRLPVLAHTLAGLAAFETVRILTNVMPPMTYGATMVLNCLGMTMELHDVLKLPRCPACSPVREAPARRVWAW